MDAMTTVLILTFAILGGHWRRILGGWLGLRRSFIFAAAPLLCLPVWLHQPGWVAGLITLAVTLFWAPGHDWTSLRALLLRYGPVGLCWWTAQRWWPDTWRAGGYIDGAFAVAELTAGAVVYGSLTAIAG